MKKYRSYIIVTVCLLAISLFYLITNRKGTLKFDNNHFAIIDTSDITRISFISGNKNLTLERSANNWIVNTKYNARIQLINEVLGLLTTLEIKAPVTKHLKAGVLESFKKKSILVKIESNLKLLKEFEVCEVFNPSPASIIREKGSEDMFFVHIPGFNKPLSLLLLPAESFWRDYIVFRYKTWEMLKIDIEYPANPENSFSLDMSKPEYITLDHLANSHPVALKDAGIVKYLLNFGAVPYFPVKIHNTLLKDSLKNIKPLCVIKIKSVENKTNTVKLFPMADSKEPGKINLFKMYAVLQNDSVPVSVKYIDFDPIMKKYREMVNL